MDAARTFRRAALPALASTLLVAASPVSAGPLASPAQSAVSLGSVASAAADRPLAFPGPLAIAAGPLPAALQREAATGWQRWGSGEMRRLGFELYRATLWVAQVDGAAASLDAATHALVLHYRRTIKRSRLVAASLDEMRRLGIAEAELNRWEPELARVFRDVEPGDTITGVHRPGVGASFYYGGTHTGDVEDADFARAFFAIWLDARTSEPRLRETLLRPPPGVTTGQG